MKAKRKAMSVRCKLSKTWSEEAAILALKAEEANARKLKDITLIIRFPDQEISREIVKSYSADIESVHFQLNFSPRYCLVHLKSGADVKKTIDELTKIPFGTGFLSVEIKQIPLKAHSTKLTEIDPFTLYVGNLPTTIACKTLKEHFPGAARIDIGFPQRMKYTRYAFIRYENVQKAIEAYNRTLDAEIGGRTITIRFRRLVAANESNKHGEGESQDDINDLLLVQTTATTTTTTPSTTRVTSEDNSTNLYQTGNKNLEDIDSSQHTNITDLAGNDLNNLCNITETNQTETKKNSEISKSKLSNLKHDPDTEPDDVVIRNDTPTSSFEPTNHIIKQEEENLALYTEFFQRPNGQNGSCEKSSIGEIGSTIDETDTMSPESTSSLGEFLHSCQQGPQAQTNKDTGPPPSKITKVNSDISQVTIKREPTENNDIVTGQNFSSLPNDFIARNAVKEESDKDNENSNEITLTQKLYSLINKKTVTGRRKKVAEKAIISKDSCNNDDTVPSTALFFRNDLQNRLPNSSNDCNYDEFYETNISLSSQTPDSLTNVKTEPLENNKKVQQNAILNQTITINNTIRDNVKTNTNATQISRTFAHDSDDNNDDDLVPAQNILGSYQPSKNIFKQEMEHDDIFFSPFHKTNRINESSSLVDICDMDLVTSLTPQLNNTENTSVISNIITPQDNDEDVVIISDNIKRPLESTKSSNLGLRSNLNLPRQTDLVSYKHNPVTLTIPNHKITKLIHHDHLDRLYDQLDADSDNEL